jgi:hypothetical protein
MTWMEAVDKGAKEGISGLTAVGIVFTGIGLGIAAVSVGKDLIHRAFSKKEPEAEAAKS